MTLRAVEERRIAVDDARAAVRLFRAQAVGPLMDQERFTKIGEGLWRRRSGELVLEVSMQLGKYDSTEFTFNFAIHDNRGSIAWARLESLIPTRKEWHRFFPAVPFFEEEYERKFGRQPRWDEVWLSALRELALVGLAFLYSQLDDVDLPTKRSREARKRELRALGGYV